MIIKSLFRWVVKEDLAVAEFDDDGNLITTTKTDNDGGSFTAHPIIASDIKVSKDIFNSDNFTVNKNDSIEDALVSLKDIIDDYTYILPDLYDYDINVSTGTLDYLNSGTYPVASGTQSDINKWFYDRITEFVIPTTIVNDYDLVLSTDTLNSLSLADGSKGSTAFIDLQNKIDNLSSYDNLISISSITKSAITGFTGSTQSDMNIFLANNSSGGGLWEQVTGTSYIKPSLLTGQTNKTSIMMDSMPIYLKDNTDVFIKTIGGYDSLEFGVKDTKLAITIDPGGYTVGMYLDSELDKGLKMNKSAGGSSEIYKIGNEDTKLELKKGYDGYISNIGLTIADKIGIIMNTDSLGYNIEMKNSTYHGLTLNKNETTGRYTTKLYNNNAQLVMGGTYGTVKLYRDTNQYFRMDGGTPAGPANNTLSFGEDEYMKMTADTIELQHNDNTKIIMESNKINMIANDSNNYYIKLENNSIALRANGTSASSITMEPSSIDIYSRSININSTATISFDHSPFQASTSTGGMYMNNINEEVPTISNVVYKDANGFLKIS